MKVINHFQLNDVSKTGPADRDATWTVASTSSINGLCGQDNGIPSQIYVACCTRVEHRHNQSLSKDRTGTTPK